MKTKKHTLYSIDSQGQLIFSRRKELAADFGKSDSIWEHPAASLIIMGLCALLDLIMFHQLFSSFLYDALFVRILSIIAMLIGFDVAPIYLGIVLKKKSQGFRTDRTVQAVLALAFAAALAANVILRVAVKDLVLPDYSSASTSVLGSVSAETGHNDLALVYALIVSVFPVITSLVSYAVSFHSSNPLKARIKKLKEEQVGLEDDIVELEAILTEYEGDGDYYGRLLHEDQRKYESMLAMIREKGCLFCHYVRECIKEHLGDSAATNELSKEIRSRLLAQFRDIDARIESEQQYPEAS